MAFSPATRNEGIIDLRRMTDEELLTKYSEMVATITRHPSARGAGMLLYAYRHEVLRRMNKKTDTVQHT